jgi:DNA repair protein RadB
MRHSTSCQGLDRLLGGGIESGAVTEIYGEGGTGKTNISLQLTRNCVLGGKKVIFIDTEGVSMERFKQICSNDFEKITKEVLFFTPYSMSEQEAMIQETVKIVENDSNVGLIVIDSCTVYYRMSFGCDDEQLQRQNLSRQVILLLAVARKFDLPVVLTNQVFHDIETNTISPIGGHILFHNAKAILKFEKVADNVRRATVMKHRSIPEGVNVEFRITNNGIEDLEPELKEE